VTIKEIEVGHFAYNTGEHGSCGGPKVNAPTLGA
jgi:hypothetical protein